MKDSIEKLFFKIKNFIGKGQARSIRAKKNILSSMLIRGTSIAISLVMVPITIDYVNPSRYGVWLTISSIVGWFSFFNIGLTDGLRNKFAEAKAIGDDAAAQMYVSTTYAILTVIFGAVWVIFLIINPMLDWVKILNVEPEYQNELSILALIVFTYFCLQFILKIISTLIIADQKPALSSLVDLVGQIFSLLFILVLVKTTEGSLVNLGIALCTSPILILIIANFIFFRGKYFKFRPLFSKINLSHSKGLFNLGLSFFVIQVAGLIQYQSANFIIAQNFGPLQVTSYSIVHKYFSVLLMLFGIFLSPFWSASTEAYYKNDIAWIKKATKKYIQLSFGFIALGVIMLLASEHVYSFWLKDNVDIDFKLSVWGFIFAISFLIANLFVQFLNGISALRIQFWSSLFSPILYVVVAWVLINKFELGVPSLFIASLFANFNGIVFAPIQYYLIIYKNKKGIWTR